MDSRSLELVSTGFVAQRVGVSPESIKRYDRDGKITPSIRILGTDRRVWPTSALPVLEREIEDLLRKSGRRGAHVA